MAKTQEAKEIRGEYQGLKNEMAGLTILLNNLQAKIAALRARCPHPRKSRGDDLDKVCLDCGLELNDI